MGALIASNPLLFCSRNNSTGKTSLEQLGLRDSTDLPRNCRGKGEGRVDTISAVGVLVRKHLRAVQLWRGLLHGVMVSTCTVRTAASAVMQEKGPE